MSGNVFENRGNGTSSSPTHAIETALETGRTGVNQILRKVFGLELTRLPEKRKYAHSEVHGKGVLDSGSQSEDDTNNQGLRIRDSSFWNPYSPNSPFMNRQKYLEQFQRLKASGHEQGLSEMVPEEDIMAYVDALAEDGSLKSVQGLSSVLVPRTLYANVVKVALRVLQQTLDKVDGKHILGRRAYILKRESIRSRWNVSSRYKVNEEVVKKLVNRVMADHGSSSEIIGTEVQQQIYQNIITLVFRVVFDLTDSCQLRVLGHTVTIHIEADEGLADAPGWDISLDSGIFGRFRGASKRKFASEFVDDLLADESINIKAMPDVFERQLYINVVLVLLEMLETACNHLRLHVAGISLRPALDDHASAVPNPGSEPTRDRRKK